MSVCAYFLIMRRINHIKKYDRLVIDYYRLRSREQLTMQVGLHVRYLYPFLKQSKF